MAEFKLGRIRFVYQGSWTAGHDYVVDDVISIGGKTYICVISHTASPAFATDQTHNPTKWHLVADGTQWTGEWLADHYYNLGDQVKYGGTVYVCTEAHQSASYVAPSYLGLEDDFDKWEAFATSLEWIGAWTANTRYKVRDIVTYGGTTYICNTKHVSDSDLLENNILLWDVFNAGINYLGDWDENSVNYKLNDVVKYGADLWICTSYHTSSAPFDITKWSVFVHGLQFEDSWSNSTTYQIGDIVTYGGYSYIAKQNHSGQTPSTATAYWEVYTTGFSFQGEWSNSTAYRVGDVVRLGAYTYLALSDHTGHTPPNNSYWSRLNTGIKWASSDQTYTGIAGTNTIGTGIGATFDVVRSGTIYTVSINNAGSLYATGDEIVISGSSVGGISPANDLTISITGVSTGAITNFTSTGISVTWTSGSSYVLGDVVFFGASSYVCVNAHTASSGNRPDADTTATYWNLMAGGSEPAVLTTTGDTFYYGPNGPTRLAAGTDGQILRVDEGFPTWTYYGVINNLVYVAPTGVDSVGDGRGLSIDRPWKSIRFAAKQVEEGYQNVNATTLLKKNKQFLLKEVENYMSYTFKVEITGTASNSFEVADTSNLSVNMPVQFSYLTGSLLLTGSAIDTSAVYYIRSIVSNTRFTVSATAGGSPLVASGTGTATCSYYYVHSKSEKDAGHVVDAVIFDLGHGGTSKTTAATLAYYNAAGTGYVNTSTGYQIPQFVSGQTYLKSLIASVLNNQQPAVSYQKLNNAESFAQVIDTTLTAESTAITTAAALSDIVINGIGAGTTTAIKTAIQPQTTISVKTGTYTEVLPIVLANNATVVGDELRGTIIQPKPAIELLANDKPKTISALNRIKAVIPNIVTNTAVVPSAGNTLTQQNLYSNNESVLSPYIKDNLTMMVNVLNGGTEDPIVWPYTANDNPGFWNGALNVLNNKGFIVSEVSAWIDAQIAANTSPFNGFVYAGAKKTACERDVGYIVEAITYDLMTSGNLATQIAARSYYSNGIFVETGEKAQALAVQNRIKSFIDNIVLANTAGWTKTTSSSQSLGTAGSNDAANWAVARIQEIYDCMNTGTTPTTISPSTSWADPALVSAMEDAVAIKSAIQADAITWINDNYPTLTYNQTTCSRDIGYIVDALSYDAAFKSNFLSRWNAMSYFRALSSTATVLADQLAPTVNVVYYTASRIERATAGTDMIVSNLNTMVDILANGNAVAPTAVYPDPHVYDNGYYNARRLILANKSFLKAEVTAWINVQIAGNTSPFVGFTYNQTACERDVGYLVDALAYDLTYQGNLATQIAARSYYSNGVLVETGEKSQALALWAHVQTIIDDIVKGTAITKSSGNSASQVTSGTAGSTGAADFAVARIQELYNTINTGTEPTTITPSAFGVNTYINAKFNLIQLNKDRFGPEVIAWIKNTYPELYFDQATCSRDVGYIVDALCYDYLFGSNFLSVWNAMSYHRALTSTGVVLTEQLQPTIGTIGLIGDLVKNGQFNSGTSIAHDRIENNANIMMDIINNGLENVPETIINIPSWAAGTLVDYDKGIAQLKQNYAFIKAEISAYLTATSPYDTVWASLTPTQKANCTRDVGYILDAIVYDMSYGCNIQSLIAGSAYYSFSVLTIGSNELAATRAAYARLKTVVGQIVTKASVTKTAGNAENQVSVGSAGSPDAGLFAQARVQDVIDWINNAAPNATIALIPADPLYNAYSALQDKKAEIQSDTVQWVKKYYQEMAFDEEVCSRDAGLIVDALAYDLFYNSNFNSIKVGMSYFRNLTATNLVMSAQKEAEIGAINFIKNKAKLVAGAGAIPQINQIIDDTTSFIDGGAVPRLLWPTYVNSDTQDSTAARAIWNNKEFIIEETIAFINANYVNFDSRYDAATCARDIGLIVDAVSYDLVTGSNFASSVAGEAYYRIQSALVTSDQMLQTVAAVTKAKTLAAAVVDATKVTASNAAFDNVITILSNGLGSVPSYTWPDNGTSTGTTVSDAAALQTNRATMVSAINSWLLAHPTYGTMYTALSADQKTKCQRDVGYMIDAVTYDLQYGGTYQSTVAGSAYYSFGTLQIASTEKAASVATLTQLATLMKAYTSAGGDTTVDTLTTVIADIINTGTIPSITYPSASGETLAVQNSVTALSTNKATIQADVTQYITDTFSIEYSRTACKRDVGYIVDAVRYDLTYGGNFATRQAGIAYYSQLTSALQIDSGDLTATLAAYGNLKTLLQDIANGGLSAYTPLQQNVDYITESSGDATSATRVGTLLDGITDTITSGIASAPAESLPSTSGVDTDLVTSYNALQSAKTTIKADVTAYIVANYPTLTYDSATCERDVGYIIDAIGYDLMLNSNFRSVKAGMSYYQNQASLVVTAQKEATIAAYNYLKILVEETVSIYDTALARVSANMQTIIDIITYGVGEKPEVHGTMSYNNNAYVANAVELLRVNKDFITNEATSWISSYFGDVVTTTTQVGDVVTTENNHNLSVGDPVRITATTVTGTTISATSTGNLITLTNVNGLVPNMSIAFGSGTALGNITPNTAYFVLTVNSATSQITMSSTYQGSVFDPGNGTGTISFNAGGVFGGLSTVTTYYVKTVPTPKTLTLATDNTLSTTINLTDGNGVAGVVYYYDEASCRRDMAEYVDSIIYDLQWTGNYRSLRAAQLYNNAVGGSEYENMFLAANATGLRNCTMTGLKGTLTNPNQYGTRRPTGGAFVALNPGFGPNDSNWWVWTRSHYSQNCTMFGSGCIGAKIDGALHAGGNRSMVKNDFTTILSDGIGVWVTGSNALTELVSVFNYYGYAGYLAELGGRIRATNGNSSYGTYGVIAEGVDTYETPIYGRLNNRAAQAQVGNVVTDGVNEILRLEYSNAGSNYTNTVTTISGSGYNAEATADEFRDAALFETRVIDANDGNGSGGDGYVTFSNTAQLGDTTSITIAATDTSLSAAYVGMRIQLTAGTGVGQYGNILTYNNGTKVATVYKDSFTALTATGTSASANTIAVASTATLVANMPIYFTSALANISANTLYYVKAVSSTTAFTISDSISGGVAGTVFDITSDTSGQTVSVLAAGWDHVIPGTSIASVLDLTTVYIIEPRISYTEPGYTATSRSLSGTATWGSVTYGDNNFVAIANSGTSTSYSTDGKTWASAGVMTTSSMIDVVYGGGEGAIATAVVGGLGGSGAVLQAVLGTGIEATQVVAVNVINGGINYNTPPTIVFTPVSGGTGATATCTVLDGQIQTVTMSINGSGYTVAPTVTAATNRLTSITVNNWGKNYFSAPSITISSPGGVNYTSWASSTSVTAGQYLITTDYNIYLVTANGITSSVKPSHTSGSAADGTATLQYYGEQAIASATMTNAGVSAISLSKKGVGYTTVPTVTILDTGARFVAIANGANNSCYQTVSGAHSASAWSAGGSTAKTDLTSIAYGAGLYVAVGGTNSAVSSSDAGATWISRTISSTTGTWSDITYGNGTFVAVSNGAVTTSTSSNGAAWSAGGNLPNSGSNTWASVAYGNGRFVAVQTNSRSVAYSLDKGTTWTLASPGLPSTQAWSHIKYAQGLFFVVATGTSVCATSPDGIYWTQRAMPSSSNWKDVAFGNTNSNPIWVAVSNTSGTIAASIRTGAKALGRMKAVANAIDSVRMVEPGSGYPKGTITATTATTNVITTNDTTNLVDSQPIEFTGLDAYGLVTNTTYYVIGSTIVSNTSFKVSETAGSSTPHIITTGTGLNGMYRAGPIVTQGDPNKVITAALRVRMGDGALGNPSFSNRGLNNATATASTLGDGYAEMYQPSTYISVSGLFNIPTAGANVEFSSLPNTWFKLVSVTNVLGVAGNYTAQFQINPGLSVFQAPAHNDLITTRLKYSQVRLTGHDYLYIGTGNYSSTNYPNVDPTTAIQANQELFSGGGRVFFTSTDQDGNFNVGDLFGVQQATGTATLNASAFNLAGLQSLQLGAVTLGVGSAIITQFSTDPYFTANSDNIVPTQKAIKAYITAQIGGGSSSLNVNTLTAGQVYIANNTISNTAGGEIRVTSKMNFTAGVDGAPVALGYFLQK